MVHDGVCQVREKAGEDRSRVLKLGVDGRSSSLSQKGYGASSDTLYAFFSAVCPVFLQVFFLTKTSGG